MMCFFSVVLCFIIAFIPLYFNLCGLLFLHFYIYLLLVFFPYAVQFSPLLVSGPLFFHAHLHLFLVVI